MMWLLVAQAFADPLALRAPGADTAAVLETAEVSVGGWVRPALGVSAELRPGGSLGVSVGTRTSWVVTPSGFGVRAAIAGGPVIPLADPTLALGVSPSISAGWACSHVDAHLGLVVPAVLRVAPDPAVRLPVLGELWVGGRTAHLSLGATLAAGPAFYLHAPGEIQMQAGLYAGWTFGAG